MPCSQSKSYLDRQDLLLPQTSVTPEQEKITNNDSYFAKKNVRFNNENVTPTSVSAEKSLHSCETEEEDPDLVYFPVNVDISNLHDWKERSNGSDMQPGMKKGELVTVNNADVAVFKYGDSVLATQARCPHAGGPLHLGDIEVLPDSSLCVRCPWHKWSFCVSPASSTRRKLFSGPEDRGRGECVWPPGRGQEGVGVKVYPTVTDKRRKTIKIGFDSFDEDTLTKAAF